MLINAHDLQAFITDIFAATACSDEEAGRIATNLVEANLKGHDSHGVIRTERYVGWLANGVQLPDQELTVITETPSFAVLDGNYGMGQTVGPLAARRGIEMAEANGVAVVALRNAGHLGRIGAYAEMAADRRAGVAASGERGRWAARGSVRGAGAADGHQPGLYRDPHRRQGSRHPRLRNVGGGRGQGLCGPQRGQTRAVGFIDLGRGQAHRRPSRALRRSQR